MTSSWVRRYGYMIAPSPTKPWIYRLQAGGYLVRTPKTTRVLPGAALADAVKVRDSLLSSTKAVVSLPLFSEFAASLLEERILKGDIESEATIERWTDALEHFLIPAFGALRVDKLSYATVQQWTVEVAKWFKTGRPGSKKASLSPATANGVLRILRTICNEMTLRHRLEANPFEGINMFRERDPYGPQNPNSVTPETLREWLAVAKRDYPQHYAIMALGFVTGRRPGELRALRWTDIDWKTGVITIAHAHSRKTQIKGTKTGTVTQVTVPREMLDILEEHRENLGKTKGPSRSKNQRPQKMRESEFVFPSTTGGIRSRSALDKPFQSIAKKLGVAHKVTPRAMRRSFQDLARAAQVEGLVTRSISGHKTEKMQQHYSTVANTEQHEGLSRMLELVK